MSSEATLVRLLRSLPRTRAPAHLRARILAAIRALPPERDPVIRVALYGKRDCPLCDELKATLLRVRRDVPFELDEVDIEASPGLLAAYGERIPLLFVNGRLAFKIRADEAALRRRLARERLRDPLAGPRGG